MTGTIASGANFPRQDKWMNRIIREVQYTGPATYVAGGDPISGPTDLGMGEIYGVYGTIGSGTAVRIAWWDYVNQKLMFLVPNTGSEASGDLSTYTGTLLFTGKG